MIQEYVSRASVTETEVLSELWEGHDDREEGRR